MKNIKKLLVAVLTFTLSICMINKVTATTNEGSITITGTTAGKTYEVYKIFDLTYSGSEATDDLKVAYTIDDAWTNFFSSAEGSEYIVSTNTGSLNAITVKTPTGYTTKYINITESNVADFANDALDYLGKTASITKYAEIEATGETTTIDNLALGYYLVYPEGATEIKNGYASIASLTSTTPNAEINIKATYPTISKTVKENSVEVGDYAKFTITGKVPNTTGYTTYTYKIHDSWTEGLEYDANGFSLTITIGNDTLTTEDYTLTLNTKEGSDEIIGFTLSLNVMDEDFEEGDIITAVYNVKVTEDAINSSTTNNSAYLEYSNNPKTAETNTTTEIEVPVYSSKIEVLKVDKASCTGDGEERTCSTPLEGAEFVLKNSEGKYYYLHLGLDENFGWSILDIIWKDTAEEATTFTTNEEGILTYADIVIGFEGLKDGTYYLEETKAPEGFNKLDEPVPVVVEGTKQNNRPVPVIKEVTVENNSGTKLPSTGGIGTKLFITIGSLLAVISAVVLVTNKRMAKEFN